jgi:hypothetical protein
VTKRYRLRATLVVLGTVTACASLTLSSTEQEVTSVTPTMVDFGVVMVGSGSGYGPITVRPATGSDDDHIAKIAFTNSCPDFKLMPGGGMGVLMGSSDGNLYSVGNDPHVFNMCTFMFQNGSSITCTPVTYTFGASFTPSSPTSQSCTARIYTYAATGGSDSSQTVTFSGSGSGSSYSMSVQPTSYYFGTVSTTGMSGPKDIVVSNTGTAPLHLSWSASDMTHFMISPSFTTPIPPQGSGTFTVTCYHPAVGLNSTMLSFMTSEGASGSASLTCDGVSSNVSVDPIDFGTVDIGSMPADVQVTFRNSGGAPASLSGFTISTALPTGEVTFDSTPPLTVPVAPGGSAMPFKVRYRPMTQSTTGSLGQLMFSDGTNSLSAPISGNAVVASIGTNPASVDFGPVCAGTSTAQDVTVQTNAAGAVRVSALSSSGAPFNATTADVLPKVLGGNGAGKVTVNASVAPPSTQAAGVLTGSFTLTTDIPNMPTRDVALSATVITAGLTPTPGSVSFSSVQVGDMSEGKSVVVANCGADDLVIGARLSGASPGDFVIESPADFANLQKTLKNGESLTLLVQMTPKTNGDKSAVLLIDHGDGSMPVQVTLDGTGYGGSDATTTTPKNRETYYACSTGRPFALVPVGLVVAWLARRRRRK